SQSEIRSQTIRQGNIEESVKRNLNLVLAQLGDTFPQPGLMLGVFDLADRYLSPLAPERLGAVGVRLAKGRAEGRLGVDLGLLLQRPIEQLVTHLEGAQDKGVTQVELDLGGLTASLGNTAALDERLGFAQQLAVRGSQIATRL